MPFPTSPPIKFSGSDAGLLVGPSTAPPGSVTVNPGVDNAINAATIANPAGTTFYMPTGTHTNNTGIFGAVTPKAGNTYIFGPDAIFDGRTDNMYSFVGTAADVTIKYADVRNFVTPKDQLCMNHDFASGWTMEYNKVWRCTGAGVGLGHNNILRYNFLTQCGQYGFQGFGDNLLIEYNEISVCGTDDWERKQYGCGCTGASKFWDVWGATIRNNWIHSNAYAGIWADTNNVGFLVEGNYFNDNAGPAFFYEISYNFLCENNNFIRNCHNVGRRHDAAGDSTYPNAAIYISESGGEASLNGGVYADCHIRGNNFEDNWCNIHLYENGNRWGSDLSGNTSVGYSTLMIPGQIACHNAETYPCTTALAYCGDPATGGSMDEEPYRTDCRWKTKNVKVHNNIFDLVPARVGIDIAETPGVGITALFSEGANLYAWSYQGNEIRDAITYNQGNEFYDNTYKGSMRWMPWERVDKTFAQWQASPYNFDAGSSYTP